MEILRLRENIDTQQFHNLSIIPDYQEKWRYKLSDFLGERNSYALKSDRKDSQVNYCSIKKDGDKLHIATSYFIGLDYLDDTIPFIVEPKFDNEGHTLNFYKILFESLPYVSHKDDISNLYTIHFDKPKISIQQQDDFLTPILVLQFISHLDKIAHSGLQKGYYWVDENLDGKVKGKILIKETIRQNHMHNRVTKTYCRYQEFGLNTLENQFLKYAFQFCLNYLNRFSELSLMKNSESDFNSKVAFIQTAFQQVCYNSTFRKTFPVKKNPLYPIYEQAISLANLILKRAAFNITTTTQQRVETYPYWIDMSQLFELHLLALLRKSFGNDVLYQQTVSYRRPDIILKADNYKFIIDAKYKEYDREPIGIEDIRQVAAYSKMKGIFDILGKEEGDVVNSIIIYPKIGSDNKDLSPSTLDEKKPIEYYYDLYKLDVDIPVLKANGDKV